MRVTDCRRQPGPIVVTIRYAGEHHRAQSALDLAVAHYAALDRDEGSARVRALIGFRGSPTRATPVTPLRRFAFDSSFVVTLRLANRSFAVTACVRPDSEDASRPHPNVR
jgi:hypothetical protein